MKVQGLLSTQLLLLLLLAVGARGFVVNTGERLRFAKRNSSLNLVSNGLFTSSTTKQSHSSSTHQEPAAQLNNRHSASDWLYNIRSLHQSQILREVHQPVLAVAAWAAAVSIVHRFLSMSSRFAHVAQHLSIPGTAHSFLVSALGLLLVFRTNSAYQRFYVRMTCRFFFVLVKNVAILRNLTLCAFSLQQHRKDARFGKTFSALVGICHA